MDIDPKDIAKLISEYPDGEPDAEPGEISDTSQDTRMAAAQWAARAGWHVQTGTIDGKPIVAATNPTNPNEAWYFFSDESVWKNEAGEVTDLIPLCHHEPYPT